MTDKELTLDVIEGDSPHGVITFFGGDPSRPTWEEYYNDAEDKYKKHIALIKEWALKQDKMPCGDEMNDKYFAFSDGEIFDFTYRGWGDLAQAAVNKREGYMTYYLRNWNDD